MPANVAPHHIIKKPLVTEKGTFAMNELTKYTFLVDPRATKTEIKEAVQAIYNVSVTGVNTVTSKGKFKPTRFGLRVEPTTKKAIVTLKKGETIELF
ncbi:MAG: 50S ribosomal protein L23 [Phycisphaeraceae bacterium]|nr:50S ribosomal protein L23 [Phycisphaeraceae bacterium]